MEKKYVVRLTTEERAKLEAMVKKSKAAAYKIKHANLLLAADVADPAGPDRQIAEAFSCPPAQCGERAAAGVGRIGRRPET
jgi:hypothetical protein